MALETKPATAAPMMHPKSALETVQPDRLLRAVSERCCGSMKLASIEPTAPEMTAVSYPNSRPPKVATNVTPVTNEVLLFAMNYPLIAHRFARRLRPWKHGLVLR